RSSDAGRTGPGAKRDSNHPNSQDRGPPERCEEFNDYGRRSQRIARGSSGAAAADSTAAAADAAKGNGFPAGAATGATAVAAGTVGGVGRAVESGSPGVDNDFTEKFCGSAHEQCGRFEDERHECGGIDARGAKAGVGRGRLAGTLPVQW